MQLCPHGAIVAWSPTLAGAGQELWFRALTRGWTSGPLGTWHGHVASCCVPRSLSNPVLAPATPWRHGTMTAKETLVPAPSGHLGREEAVRG